MRTRLISAIAFVIILAVAFVLKFYVSNYFFDVAILAVAMIASFEASKLFTKTGKYNEKYMALIFPCLLMLTLLLGISYDSSLGIVYTIVIAVAVLIFSAFLTFLINIVFFKKSKLEIKTRKLQDITLVKFSLNKALNTMIIFIYPAFLISFLTLINHFEDMTTSFAVLSNLGGYISLFVLLFAFLVPVFTDTFAYLMGGLFGGKKIFPKISPNKTVAGSVGGFLWCILLSVAVFFIFNAVPAMETLFIKSEITVWKIAIISGIGSIIGQAGDLLESYLKRTAGVKDSGNIMPGHGGFLDRFDSHTLVAPFIFIAFSIIFALL